ncbi:MAG: trypsin-like peptidase domain-containing protein [Lachnospiraceae bacterium]|nr:trypsin-like peptidase domain-containing protein [Lachnospiraceae bacterium]
MNNQFNQNNYQPGAGDYQGSALGMNQGNGYPYTNIQNNTAYGNFQYGMQNGYNDNSYQYASQQINMMQDNAYVPQQSNVVQDNAYIPQQQNLVPDNAYVSQQQDIKPDGVSEVSQGDAYKKDVPTEEPVQKYQKNMYTDDVTIIKSKDLPYTSNEPSKVNVPTDDISLVSDAVPADDSTANIVNSIPESEAKPAKVSKKEKKAKKPDESDSSAIPKERGFGYKILVGAAVGLIMGAFAALAFWGVNKLTGTGIGTEDRQTASVSSEPTDNNENSVPKVPELPDPDSESENEGTQLDGNSAIPEISKVSVGENGAPIDVSAVAEMAMPCVVSVNNTIVQRISYFGQSYSMPSEGAGSGIIIGQNDTELLIATNNHVVAGSSELSVTFTDDSTIPAQIKGTYEERDLAIIAVLLVDIPNSVAEHIAIAELGDSNALKVGEPVIAIGNSLGYGQSVTTGVVSALNRPIMSYVEAHADDVDLEAIPTFIQTDAAINPGNSGGALLNMRGEVIGINSNKIGGSKVEGMGYAIPISDAMPILEELMSLQTKLKVSENNRGVLGISGINVERSYSELYGMPVGVYVSTVNENSAAERYGLKKGDVIIGIGDQEITTMQQLKKEMEYHAAGETIQLIIMRDMGGTFEEQVLEVVLDPM